MANSKVLNLNTFLLSNEKRKELTLKENKLKESCRTNLTSPFKTNLQKRLVWLHIHKTTNSCSS